MAANDSRDIAEKAFGKDVDPVGKTLNFGYIIRIVGVVEPTSSIMEESFGQLFLALDQEAEQVIVVLKEGCTVQDLTKELEEIVRRRSVSDKEYDYAMHGMILPHAQWKMTDDGEATLVSWKRIFISLFPKVFVLLLVPALNLSGLVAARMRRRLAEMGVRKAFGATRRTLLTQVISENLLLLVIRLQPPDSHRRFLPYQLVPRCHRHFLDAD